MPDRPAPIDEADFTEVFLHGSGPGGQKINKTSSAVQLKHIPTEEKAAKAEKENAEEDFEDDALEDEGVNPEDMEIPRQDSSKKGGDF
ncbi:hypothetical protein DID88_004878 [Monilinia fructigena]|uniref:Prokaryotic-type class I peptide chain release factors domain-containing protein n=1 Tax=Monilinia fructigena TaxID=38457 RepID=A0A395IPV9_9HELO|nr:hypothetical protein DID88_004878 [Monilinia fructigena]